MRLRSLIRLRAATVLGTHATARPSVVPGATSSEIPGEFREGGGEKGEKQKTATAEGAGSSRADETVVARPGVPPSGSTGPARARL